MKNRCKDDPCCGDQINCTKMEIPVKRRAFFCWEHNQAMVYGPVVYYDELPESKSRRLCRKQVVEITNLEPGPDGEYSPAGLANLYPLKEDKNANDS